MITPPPHDNSSPTPLVGALCLCRQKLLPSSSSSSELSGLSLLERGAAAPKGAVSGSGAGHYIGMKSLVVATVSWMSHSVCCDHMSVT